MRLKMIRLLLITSTLAAPLASASYVTVSQAGAEYTFCSDEFVQSCVDISEAEAEDLASVSSIITAPPLSELPSLTLAAGAD